MKFYSLEICLVKASLPLDNATGHRRERANMVQGQG